jgi:hypothetical protein
LASNKTSETRISFTGRRNSWLHTISHSSLSFDASKENVSKVELRCQNAVYKFTELKVKTFEIPKNYSGCQLLVQGKLDANFKLTEQAI